MKTPLLILPVLVLTYTAHARLGETPDQITLRYGAGSVLTSTNDDKFIESFDHNGYRVRVTFWNGKSAEEVLTRMVAGSSAMIFQDDGDKLFHDVSGEGKVIADRSGHSSLYKNKATGATGMLLDDTLTVQTKAYVDYCAKKFAGQSKEF